MAPVLASVFVITAPSGAGKSSLVREVLRRQSDLQLSVSHTTRPPRSGEKEGIDYHFVPRETFIKKQQEGEFLESAEVYGNFYGTSQHAITASLKAGIDVLLEIDWQGARQVRALFPDCVDIFILPPSLSSLRERLESRGTDPPETIARRLAAAHEDLSHVDEFQYVIINDDFSKAVEDLSAIISARRCRRDIQRGRHPNLFLS
jgi:guanylate kinase